MRRFHVRVRHQGDVDTVARIDGGDVFALLVEQEGGHVDRQLGDHVPGLLLHGLFLDQSQHGQGEGLDTADRAVAVTARTDDLAGFAQRRAQALARHLKQPKAGNAADLHPGAVHLEGLAQAILHLALVLARRHVDEVDDDQAAEVTQAQLTCNLVGRLQIGVEGGFLDVAALGGSRRVDVDRGEGLGVVDDQ